MKYLIWKAALSCGLALSATSAEAAVNTLPVEETTETLVSQVGRGSSKGGGHQGGAEPRGAGSSSGRSDSGHGRSPSPRGGIQVGGRGGIHAPSINSPRNSRGHGGQIAGANRSPSFSRPPVRTGVDRNTHNQATRHLNDRRSLVFGSGASRPMPSLSGQNNRHDNNHFQRDQNILQRQRNGQQIRNARIGHQPFGGNSIRLHNKAFSVGNSHYQPSHYRHSGYHGYWNGNRRINSSHNIISAVAYGLGSSFGNGNSGNYNGYVNNYGGYSNGWGWGLGNNFRGNRGFQSYSGYGYRPLGWGLGGWGLGSLNYSSGYLGYSNPYYVNSGTTVYNYAQPIPVSYNVPVVISEGEANSSEAVLNSAVEAFRLNNYDQALDITNKGIAQYPDDAVLHEFRALVLFANQDYQQAAATIHSVLAVGPGWDWTTMSGMYSDANLYTEQLRALEAFSKSNPQDSASHLLLGYHYMTCGYPDAAAVQLRVLRAQMPNDRVAEELLRMIVPPESAKSEQSDVAATSPSPAQDSPDADIKPVDQKAIVGSWSSQRDDGAAFRLDLMEDAKFTWSFTPKDQSAQEFSGTYTVEQNVLVLERTDGGSLVAEITQEGSGNFNFRLLGAADEDKGLSFSK